MRIEIEIPKEFEEQFKQDKFNDCFSRVLAEMHYLCGNYEKETITMLIKAFKESNPAYDIDKVVEELEKLSNDTPLPYENNYEPGISEGIDMAIEIVKQGGVETDTETIRDKATEQNNHSSKKVPYEFIDYVEGKCEIAKDDDVCKWLEDAYGRWHTQCNILADNSPLKYTYCPYCGKKIKVVEQMEKLTDLKYDITKLDATIENMRNRIEKMALHEKTEVGIGFLTSTVKYFEKLREYLRAEEQGLLLRFPCKIGDTVWFIGAKCNKCEKDDCYGCPYRYGGDKKDEKFVYSMIVEQFSVQNDSIYLEDTDLVGSSSKTSINAKQLGKTLFLTKEEAEQKLKERA